MTVWTNQAKPMPKGISFCCPQTAVIQRLTVRAGNVTTFRLRFITLFVNQGDFWDSLSKNQLVEHKYWEQYPEQNKRVRQCLYFESVFVVLHRFISMPNGCSSQETLDISVMMSILVDDFS